VSTDELWDKPDAAYTVHESEVAKPVLVSPFLVSAPNHPIFLICRNEPNGEMILLH
jgi:hypothetical protein